MVSFLAITPTAVVLRGTELRDEASPDCVSFATNEKKKKKKEKNKRKFIHKHMFNSRQSPGSLWKKSN